MEYASWSPLIYIPKAKDKIWTPSPLKHFRKRELLKGLQIQAGKFDANLKKNKPLLCCINITLQEYSISHS